MTRLTIECMHGTRNIGYGGPHERDKGNKIGNDIGGSVKEKAKETAQIGELCVLIEKVWREYQDLQDQYRKLTGREYEWLK